MSDVTNYDGRLEAMANYCKSMYENLAVVENAYHDSTSNAYKYALPDKYLDFKSIKALGGKTLVWNQLVDTGTTEVSTISGHKYYTLINGTASIVTSDGTAIAVVDDSADMVVDLTLCFGVGNEPATTSAFTEVFPAAHYDYNAGMLLSAGVTDVISKDSNDDTLQTYSIPAEVQALEGYGWSAGTVSNYIDFERKVFIKCVDRVNLGELSWGLYAAGTASERFAMRTTIANAKSFGNGDVANAICKSYITTTFLNVLYNYDGKYNKTFSFAGKGVTVKDLSFTDESTFTTSLSGVYMYYELAEPVETDISEYLTDETITEAEADGSITFENQLGDDYCIPVPVELEYIGV